MSSAATTASPGDFAGARAAPAAVARTRLIAIDALRGLVMLFMLVDHVRETWYLHHQVSDPVDAATTDPALFFTRLLSTFCAPTFVALTGLSAWLYGQSHSKEETSIFLLKRGLFLMALEVTLVGLAWPTSPIPSTTFWLQVIWAIGISMVALAGLLHLPRLWQVVVGLVIVCGHNLLDGIVLAPGDSLYVPWAMIHQRSIIELSNGLMFKTTYPVLPWIGLILLGYAAGPWFARGTDPAPRIRRLALLGLGMLAAFVLLRFANVYGDKPWFHGETGLRTAMSFLAMTKYPPSLLFLLPTVGVGALLLALFEKYQDNRLLPHLTYLGGAPMFFYLLHLYMLKLIYNIALAIYGPTKGTVFGVDHVWVIWMWVAILAIPLYLPTRWFAGFKQRRRDIGWLKYL